MGLFNMSGGQGMGQPGQQMPAPFDPMQGQQSPGLFNFSTPQAISNPQQAMPQQAMPQQPMPQQANPSGRIKPSFWGVLADGLSGAAGQPGQYAKTLNEQRQHQMDMAMMSGKAQQQQAYEYARQQALYQFKVANPEPNDLAKTVSYYQSIGRPDLAKTFMQQHALNGGALMGPTYTNPQTGEVVGGAPQVGDPAAPGVTFTPMNEGGQTPPASGNFPR